MTKQIEKRDETIKNSMNYLSDIIDSMESGVVTTDSQGGIVLVNRLAKKYFEQLNDPCEGVKFWEQVPQFELFHKTWDEVINFNVEKSQQKSKLFNDITRYFNISIFPLSSEKQKGTVIRIEEVTESVKNEDQLRQAQKMETIGFLAGGLAHDFNNVLGGIIGTVSLIKFNFSKSNYDIVKLTKHIETIEESGQRASDMVKQLLTLSKKHELSLNKMDLNSSLKHVVKICNNTFDKSIEINVKYHPDYAYVMADSTQIEQVLLNICVNSSHAMTIMRKDHKKLGGTLDISINPVEFKHYHSKFDTEHRVGEFWNIKIEDSGVGIPKTIMDKVFDPFFTTKDKDKGTGLGLSMVYNIIKQHDGFVDIYSDQDIGTTFNIFLPRKELDNSEIERKVDQYQVFDGTGTILVIDDEEIMRNLASTILEEMGYNIITAVNGKDGLNKFRSSPVKIKGVLLDMAMPIMSGKETFIHLKEIDPEIKVVMASGFKQDIRVKDSLKLGVLGFIDKPYNISQLSRVAKKYFED
jgi:nitrogen-specific signal transduction histidine kinase